MEKSTREELAKRAAQIFERKPEIQDIIGIEDGQFFLNQPNNMGAVIGHCKENNLEYFTITREESLNPKPESTPESASEKPLGKMNKAELIAKATALEIEFQKDATNKDLIALIESKLSSIE
ncbi:MAG: hypothetical protein LCH37_13000 [Bacteroidetes bacterium]|nr:hypothetical protein [Bacteroidota bacterium]